MSYTLIICLIIIGFILLTLEILVFPGTSVAGILGLGALVFSVYETFATHGNTRACGFHCLDNFSTAK